MPKKNEELTLIFLRERFRWGETTINACLKNEDAERYAKLEKQIRKDPFAGDLAEIEKTVKVDCDEGELEPGITYRFYGAWSKHWKHGWQFAAKTFTKITPHDKTGVINYLMRAPGIGKVRAGKLWDAYAGDAVKMLREKPAVCANLFAMGGDQTTRINSASLILKKFDEAAAHLEEEKGLEGATIDCVSLLAGRGFPKRLPKEVIKTWGNVAAEKIRKNPYALMKFKGVGFARTDDLYIDLGLNPAKLKRQTLAIWYAIAKASDGHTWFGIPFIEASLRERLAGADGRPVAAIRLGLRSGIIAKYRDIEGRLWFCTARMSEDESSIAEKLAFLSTRESAWPEMLMSGLSDHQGEQLGKATATPVGIFSGNPGTGKSFTAARLVQRIAELSGYENIAVVAPTGKAAVRVTEAMQECGADVRAKTVHSLLKVESNDGGEWCFEHGENNPIEQRYVIVDESSMLDIPIMAALIRAMRSDGHLLLVGDIGQLPPVGHGAPLRDLLLAQLPYGELTEIRRNSGAIVETCAAIRNEKPLELHQKINMESGRNIAIKRCGDSQMADSIERIVVAARDRHLCDATWDLQVIVALNEKSSVSRAKLNKSLQAELNSKNRQKGRFWPNDKIVCLRNQLLPVEHDMMETVDDDLDGMIGETSSGDAACYVANGEIGRVIAVYPNRLIMEFFSPRRVVVCPKAEGAEIEGFDLGYAISCHKSQGSQWKVIIVALDPSGGARRVCDRSWIYTSISRASEICFLVGNDRTLTNMCRHTKIHDRKTFLVQRFYESMRQYEKESSSKNART